MDHIVIKLKQKIKAKKLELKPFDSIEITGFQYHELLAYTSSIEFRLIKSKDKLHIDKYGGYTFNGYKLIVIYITGQSYLKNY